MFLLPWLLLIVPGLSGKDSDVARLPVPPNLYLVHARASTMVDGKPAFVIDRVFVGEDSLKGKEFRVFLHEPLTIYRRGPALGLPVKTGEEGFWWVRKDPKKNTLFAEMREDLLFDYGLWKFPFRKWDYSQLSALMKTYSYPTQEVYAAEMVKQDEQNIRFVAAIQNVYRTRLVVEQVDLLKNYAAQRDSSISPWAMQLLTKVDGVRIENFARGLLTNNKVPVLTQTIADRALCERGDGTWQGSAARREVLKRWIVGQIPDAGNSGMGCMRIKEALRKRQLDYPTFFRLFAVLQATENHQPGARQMDWFFEAPQPKTREDRDFVFDGFVNLIRLRPEISTQLGNVASLANCRPFSTEQIRILHNLRKSARAEVRLAFDKLATTLAPAQECFAAATADFSVLDVLSSRRNHQIILRGSTTVAAWDLKKKARLREFRFDTFEEYPSAIALLPGEDSILVATEKSPGSGALGWRLRRCQLATGKSKIVYTSHSHAQIRAILAAKKLLLIEQLDYAPPAQPVLLRLVNFETNKEVASLSPPDSLRFLAVSPDGTLLALDGGQGKITIWETASLKMKTVSFAPGISEAMITPDNKRLISLAPAKRRIVVGDIATRRQVHEVKIPAVNLGDISSDGKTLLAFNRDHVYFVDLQMGTYKETRAYVSGYLASLKLTPDGRSYLVGDTDRYLRFFRMPAGLRPPETE